MAFLYEDIKDMYTLCGEKLLKIKKGVNIYYFKDIDNYGTVNVNDIPVNEINISYGGVKTTYNPFTVRTTSEDYYLVTFTTKRDSIKKMHVYLNHTFYDSNTSKFVESIKNFVGYNDNTFEDVEKFINSFHTLLRNEYNRSKKEKEIELDRIDRENNKVSADKKDIIESKALTILDKLGKTVAQQLDDDLSKWTSYKKIYELYGLEIIKVDNKNYLKEGIWIKYKGKTVLSPEEKYTYEEGRWEELFDEIYNNLNKLSRNIDSNNSSLEILAKMMEKVSNLIPLFPLYNTDAGKIEFSCREIVKITNDLMKDKNMKLSVTSSVDGEADYFSNYHYYPNFSLENNGEKVMNIVYHSISDDQYNSKLKYIPCGQKYYSLDVRKFDNGNWVNELNNYVNDAFVEMEKKKDKDYNDEIDKKLIMIKNL